MSWKFVFNNNDDSDDRARSIALAYEAGYKFMTYRGLVFFILSHSQFASTGLDINDLY